MPNSSRPVHVLQALVSCFMHTSSSSLQRVRNNYPRPSTYLPFTVFNIICCCALLGIFAKRYGAKVGTRFCGNIRWTLAEIHAHKSVVLPNVYLISLPAHLYPLPGSLQVIYEHEKGNYAEAERASKKAFRYNIAALLSGIVIWIIVIGSTVAYVLAWSLFTECAWHLSCN